MGVYKKTNMTHSGRPVWQSTAGDDIFLFYNGNIRNRILMVHNQYLKVSLKATLNGSSAMS